MNMSERAKLAANVETYQHEIASGLVNRREVIKMARQDIAELEALKALVNAALASRSVADLRKAEQAFQSSAYFQSLIEVF